MDSIGLDGSRGAMASLTFSWLHERLRSYTTGSRRVSSVGELWSLGIGIAMTVLGLSAVAAGAWIPSQVIEVIAKVCIAFEMAAFICYIVLTLRSELPQFTRPRETHALEIDQSFVKWQALIAEVGRFPRFEREARLRFALALRQRMVDRMGLVYGGLQHLGVFPLLIAFYLQLRNSKWGEWASAFDVNPAAALLIFMIFAMYVFGWLLVGLRARVDMYVSVLEESLRDSP